MADQLATGIQWVVDDSIGAITGYRRKINGVDTAYELDAAAIQSLVAGGGGASGAAGTIGSTPVVITLADLGLVGKLHRLSVAPDTGCTILVEQSSDGSSYTTLASVTATTSWDYTPLPSESAVTHVRLTRSAGSSVASTYAIG